MVTINQQIAERVTAAIERAGKSTKGVSDETGIARTTLSRRLSGTSPFGADELILIGRVVGVDASTFLTGMTFGGTQ